MVTGLWKWKKKMKRIDFVARDRTHLVALHENIFGDEIVLLAVLFVWRLIVVHVHDRWSRCEILHAWKADGETWWSWKGILVSEIVLN